MKFIISYGLIGLVFFTKGLYGCEPGKFDNGFVGCILCEKGHYCPGGSKRK